VSVLIKSRLRVLRAEREWSQARLAAEVGVTRQTINSIEKGTVPQSGTLWLALRYGFIDKSILVVTEG
jgi:DNA-binding XRE family transcriptional regulator